VAISRIGHPFNTTVHPPFEKAGYVFIFNPNKGKARKDRFGLFEITFGTRPRVAAALLIIERLPALGKVGGHVSDLHYMPFLSRLLLYLPELLSPASVLWQEMP
jgi:hypothetical protein